VRSIEDGDELPEIGGERNEMVDERDEMVNGEMNFYFLL